MEIAFYLSELSTEFTKKSDYYFASPTCTKQLCKITAVPKLFIGMDIHKKSCRVHLRTGLFDHKDFRFTFAKIE